MGRRNSSVLDDIAEMSSKLPWWGGVTLALISYAALHAYGSQPVMPAVVAPGQLGAAAARGLWITLAKFGQYVFPFAFALGALVSAINAVKQKRIFNRVAARDRALNELTWADFERLVSEYYRRQGFQVSRRGGNGPDGGVDVVLRQKGEVYFVQCKQWKAYKVGVQPVREFYGVMAAQGVAGGFFVTSGDYSAEARRFAAGLNLELIDGDGLRKMIDIAQQPMLQPLSTMSAKADGAAAGVIADPITSASAAVISTAPLCPLCGAQMSKRVARQGRNAGKQFWGCTAYPTCKGISPIADDPVTEVADVPGPATPPPAAQKNCPSCGTELVTRKFMSGPRTGEQFLACLPCKKGWSLEQPA